MDFQHINFKDLGGGDLQDEELGQWVGVVVWRLAKNLSELPSPLACEPPVCNGIARRPR
jgi:hypothetical protein